MPLYEPLVNLESKFDDKKGIYVLTLTGKKPFKIGATNDYIGSRIGTYVNCPSSHEGHYIHMLLVWDKSSTLDATGVERFIFNELSEFRLSSNMRTYGLTEHFDTSKKKVQEALIKARDHFSTANNILTFEHLKSKDARVVKKVGKRNYSRVKGKGLDLNGKGNKLSTHGQMIVFLR